MEILFTWSGECPGKAYSEDKAKKNKRGTEPGHGVPGGFTKNSGQVNKNKTVQNVNSFNVLFTNSDTLTQSKLQELRLRVNHQL